MGSTGMFGDVGMSETLFLLLLFFIFIFLKFLFPLALILWKALEGKVSIIFSNVFCCVLVRGNVGMSRRSNGKQAQLSQKGCIQRAIERHGM